MSDSAPDGEFPLPTELLEFPSFLLQQVVKQARRLGLETSREPLRTAHVTVLASLAEFGAASQKEISERLGMDASDLVSLLDDLEQQGLANRRRDERDRRRYVVTITPAGDKALRARLATVRRLNDELLAPLSENERRELRRMLIRIYAHHDPRRAPSAGRH